MKQIRVEQHGEPEVLKVIEVDEPTPSAGEVRVAVRAAGVNYADIMQRQGLYPGGPTPPYIAGFEISGLIDAVGPGVDRWNVGDRVMGLCSGGYSEKVVVPAKSLFPVPASLSLEQAAAIPCQYLTAYHALVTLGGIREGWNVLIQAAAGGLGTQLVQIAKIKGATVIGTSGSDEKCNLVRELGCDHPVNYNTSDFRETVREVTQGKGCELIIESVGGSVFDKSLECLRPRGRLVVIGIASRQPRPVNTLNLLRDNITVSGFHLNGYLADREAMGNALRDLNQWVESGELKVIQDLRYPLEQAAQAHADIAARKTHGKVILTVG